MHTSIRKSVPAKDEVNILFMTVLVGWGYDGLYNIIFFNVGINQHFFE